MTISVRFCCIIFAVLASVIKSQSPSTGPTITIPLNKTLIYNDKELYGEFYTLRNLSSVAVNFTAVGKKLSFIIFQVHSHLYDVTLRKSTLDQPSVGTNLGLYSSVAEGLGTYTVENGNNFALQLFIGVYGYNEIDPIPGGCNMEFPIPISPFMRVLVHNKTYIDVEVSAPQNPSLSCEFPVPINFYMMYLPERNFDADTYFQGIRSMTNLKTIREFGTRIPLSSVNYWNMRRRISAYPGTGAVFVAVAEINETWYSVYVPIQTYACSPLLQYDCDTFDDFMSTLLMAVLIFIGVCICYFGHRYFKMQILSFGFLSGFVVTYIVLSLIYDLDGPALVIASALSGLCIGGLRLVCWWLYGIPAFIIALSSADMGFLIASALYYMSPGGVFLNSDAVFWSLFILIILGVTLCLLSTSNVASIVCCVVIGAYSTIYALDNFLGSNLRYIINNTVRRATVGDFNKAVIMPVYQWKDIFLTLAGLCLAVSGFLYQYNYSKGRPPFPPPPRSVRALPEYPVEPVVRRKSSIARYWEKWLQQRRNMRDNVTRTIDERTPLLEE